MLLLAEIERLGIAEYPTKCIDDPRDPAQVPHSLAEMLRFRTVLIAAGYPNLAGTPWDLKSRAAIILCSPVRMSAAFR